MNCTSTRWCHGSSTTTLTLIISITFFFILALTAIISTTTNLSQQRNILNFTTSIFPTCNSSQNLKSHNHTTTTANLRILIGILTIPDSYTRRSFLRQVYGTQYNSIPNTTQIDIKFILCNLTNPDQTLLITLETLHHNDIIILNCTENMNKGKTHTFFSSLPTLFNHSPTPYHYVMKADDDTYIRLPQLITSLTPLPRSDLYYGFVIPCERSDPFNRYMSGMGYLVSWDIVEWIKESNAMKEHRHDEGPEDRVFGERLNWGKKGKNRFNAKWGMYNYPIESELGMHKCSHELWPDTIAVHLLKTTERWVKVLRYFNVTDGFNPSGL